MAAESGLVQVNDGIWTVEGEAKLMPGFYFPVRSTLIRMQGGDLLLHSPIDLPDTVVSQIRALGEVTTIFAPNLYHNLFLRRAQVHFPEAKLVGPVGLEKKKTELKFDLLIGADTPAPFSSDLQAIFIDGVPRINEIALFHAPSRSLLFADYFFNIKETRGMLTPLALKFISGGYGKPVQSRMWQKLAKDRASLKASALQIEALDYERILLCHGSPIEDGRAFTRRAVGWLLES